MKQSITTWPESAWESRARGRAPERSIIELALAEIGPVTDVSTLAGGQANTTLRCAIRGDDDVVLRILRPGRRTAVEAAILARAANFAPIPATLHRGELPDGREFSVTRWVRGRHPHQILAAGDPERSAAMATELGRTLGRLSHCRFDRNGLFDEGLGFSRAFDSVGHSFRDLIRWSLRDGRAGKRVGPSRAAALWEWTERVTPVLDDLDGGVLVHGDFKSPNILTSPTGDVVALLDWEFASSFHPLLDVGVFFRHRELFDADFERRFAAGFDETAPRPLPPDWRALATMLDVMNLVGFLNAPADRPEAFRSVIGILDRTLRELP